MVAEKAICCPRCAPLLAVTSVAGIALAPDAFWDEIHFYLFHCAACGCRCALLHLSSGHGSLDGDDTSSREGYILEKGKWEALHKAIAECSRPQDENCRCASHASLSAELVPDTWLRFPRGGVVERFKAVWA